MVELFKSSSNTGDHFMVISDLENNEEHAFIVPSNRNI